MVEISSQQRWQHLFTDSGINISRGNYNGPLFDLPFSDSIGDPSLLAIRKKFKKKYTSPHPIHLLAYFDLNPMYPEEFWIPPIEEYLKTNINSCGFEKIWIYDIHHNKILFIYP